jgi:hypothetical protein
MRFKGLPAQLIGGGIDASLLQTIQFRRQPKAREHN